MKEEALFSELGALILGWYDFERINVPQSTPTEKRRMVQVHEQIHQLLNQGSPFGFILDRLGGLARQGTENAEALLEKYLKTCRATHEVAATYLGVVLTRDSNLTLLDEQYSSYFRIGEELVKGLPDTVYWRAITVAQISQCAFLTEWNDAIEKVSSSDSEFMAMASDYISNEGNHPDRRLESLLRASSMLCNETLSKVLPHCGLPQKTYVAFSTHNSPRAIVAELLLSLGDWSQLVLDFEQVIKELVHSWADVVLPGISDTRGKLFNAMVIRHTVSEMIGNMGAAAMFEQPKAGTGPERMEAEELDQEDLEKFLPSRRKGGAVTEMLVGGLNAREDLLPNIAVTFSSGLSMSLAKYFPLTQEVQRGNPDLFFHLRRIGNQRLLTDTRPVELTFAGDDDVESETDGYGLISVVEDASDGSSFCGHWKVLRLSNGSLLAAPEKELVENVAGGKKYWRLCENRHHVNQWGHFNRQDGSKDMLLHVEENVIDFLEALNRSGTVTKWYLQENQFDDSSSASVIFLWVATWENPFFAMCNQVVVDAMGRYLREYIIDPTRFVQLTEPQACELLDTEDLSTFWRHPCIELYRRGKVFHNWIN